MTVTAENLNIAKTQAILRFLLTSERESAGDGK